MIPASRDGRLPSVVFPREACCVDQRFGAAVVTGVVDRRRSRVFLELRGDEVIGADFADYGTCGTSMEPK